MIKELTITLTALFCVHSAVAQTQPTPEELGWEAGVVAPSPLSPKYDNPTFKTRQEAEDAKAIAQAELERIEKLRAGHMHLCQSKLFVNDCYDNAERVLQKRSRIARQLIRTADHQIRSFAVKERQAEGAKREARMPAKRAEVKQPVAETEQQKSARIAQEQANEQAYEAKVRAQEERVAKMQQEAQERKAQRLERQKAHEAELKERQAAQERQSQEQDKGLFF